MTAPAWCPGAVAYPSSHDAGSMLGGGAYVTWHTYEAGYDLTVARAARGLIAAGNEVHLCFNPVLGGVAQILPATRAARGLRHEGSPETNRRGRIHIQIEVVARAARPWTKDLTPAGLASLRQIMAWLDALGVPRVHPAGNQGPLTGNGPFNRSATAWMIPGHFCHGDAPAGNVHWDHGGVLMTDIWAVLPLGPPPPPPPPTEEEELMAVMVVHPITKKLTSLAAALWSMWFYILEIRTRLAAISASVAAIAAKLDVVGVNVAQVDELVIASLRPVVEAAAAAGGTPQEIADAVVAALQPESAGSP